MKGGGGAGHFNMLRGNYKSLKGTNLTIDCSKKTSLYHLPGIVYYSRRFDVRCGM